MSIYINCQMVNVVNRLLNLIVTALQAFGFPKLLSHLIKAHSAPTIPAAIVNFIPNIIKY